MTFPGTRTTFVLLAAALLAGVIAAPSASASTSSVAPVSQSAGKTYVWVSGTVKNGYGMQIAAVDLASDTGVIRRGTISPSGKFKIAIPAEKIEGAGLLLINSNGASAGPIVLSHTKKKAYLELTSKSGKLGKIELSKHYALVKNTLPSSAYSTAGAMKIKNGKIDGLPAVLKAILAPKGGATQECLYEPWAKGENTEGYELIDQQYKHVWGNRVITKEHWEGITLPPTWLFWIKNSPRDVVGKGEFTRSPTCPNDGQFSYKDMYDARWMNLTDFVSLNQPIDEAGTWTKSIMVKQHILTYSVGTIVWYVTDPNGVKNLIITRDPQRTTDEISLLPGWSRSKDFTLTKELKYYLMGDDITNIRSDNGDSYQSCPTCDFPNLSEYTG